MAEEELDTSWLETFKESEKTYNEFYKEPVAAITIFLFYVNKDNELAHVHTDKCTLAENGWLKREVIVSFIKRYQLLFTINYKLLSLLRYNIDLDPIDITDFVNEEQNNNRFIKSERYLNDIHFADSIRIFQDLNALFFIFCEEKPVMNQTKRVIISQPSSHRHASNRHASNRHTTKRNNERLKKNLKIIKEIS